MPGWNLKEGTLSEEKISEDELWSLFNYVFSDACRKTNTYKFGVIKSIGDQIYDLHDDGHGYILTYDKLFSKFTENYWNLVNKYSLKQMAYNGKSEFSKVELIIKEAAQVYNIPENVTFQTLGNVEREKITKAVTAECKKCVIGALYNDFEGKFYAFKLRGDGVVLGYEAYRFVSRYKVEIERLNYYSWAKFLEKVNEDNVLIRILEKLELATPQRKDLSLYRNILYKEFQENRCFYCGKRLDKNIHVDHFIPWIFVKNDNLWNFVLSCPKCNLRKRDSLVGQDYLIKLENRNHAILETFGSRKEGSFIKSEFCGYHTGLLNRMWNYAKMSGIREKDGFIENQS